MPVTFNVGYSRKVGEPNFGSRGASVNLQIEREMQLNTGADAVRLQIEELFELARTSVEFELTRVDAGHPSRLPAHRHSTSQRITSHQIQAIQTLLQRKRVDLAGLLQQHGGSKPLDQLTRQQASRMITELNARTEPAPR